MIGKKRVYGSDWVNIPFEEKSDWAALFDADNYLYFNADTFLSPARTALETKFLHDHLSILQSHAVLDLACGHGRHANYLADMAGRVVAWDNNAKFIDLARRHDAASGRTKSVEYCHRDIRTLDATAEFDRVLLLNTVFGIFNDDDSLALLIQIHRALRPGGLLCFDVVNRDTILVDFQPDSVQEKDGNFLRDRLTFDPKTGRMWNRRVYVRSGHETAAPFSLRLFNYTELAGMLTNVGFAIQSAFGNWEADPFTADSKKIVIVAQRLQA